MSCSIIFVLIIYYDDILKLRNNEIIIKMDETCLKCKQPNPSGSQWCSYCRVSFVKEEINKMSCQSNNEIPKSENKNKNNEKKKNC